MEDYTEDHYSKFKQENDAYIAQAKKTMAERRKILVVQRKTPFLYRGVDLKSELKRYARTEELRPHLDLRSLPKLRVMYSQYEGGTKGVAFTCENRIVLTIGFHAPLPSVLVLLLHELVHIACPRNHHGTLFIKRLNHAARELWGAYIESPYDIEIGEHGLRAYAVDANLRTQLAVRLALDELPEYRLDLRPDDVTITKETP